MKNIEISSDLKKIFDSLINEHPGLSSVMTIISLDNQKIKIIDIVNELYASKIILYQKGIYTIYIDYLTKHIKLTYPDLPYQFIYEDYKRKHIIPIGYEAKNDKRTIFVKNLVKLNMKYANACIFEIKERSFKCNVSIDTNKTDFNKYDFIDKILNYENNISSIRELLILITKIININDYYVSLLDNNNCLIKIDKGVLISYCEYKENEVEKNKIFFENNDFYIERSIKEKYDGDIKSFMKKIGVYNGKEKRKD